MEGAKTLADEIKDVIIEVGKGKDIPYRELSDDLQVDRIIIKCRDTPDGKFTEREVNLGAKDDRMSPSKWKTCVCDVCSNCSIM